MNVPLIVFVSNIIKLTGNRSDIFFFFLQNVNYWYRIYLKRVVTNSPDATVGTFYYCKITIIY